MSAWVKSRKLMLTSKVRFIPIADEEWTSPITAVTGRAKCDWYPRKVRIRASGRREHGMAALADAIKSSVAKCCIAKR
jgi:hypothetical protein